MAVEHRSLEAEAKRNPSALGSAGPPVSFKAPIPRQGDEPPVTSGQTSASRQPTALLFTLRLPGSEGGWTGPLTPGERTPRNSGDRVLANRNPLLLFRLDGVLLLRLADRALFALLFHEPPRNTRFDVTPSPVIWRASSGPGPAQEAARTHRGAAPPAAGTEWAPGPHSEMPGSDGALQIQARH